MGEDLAVSRRLRAAGREFACFGRAARAGARAHGAPPWRTAVQARRARRRGFDWDEMAALGLLDPSLGPVPAPGLVGSDELRRARRRVNSAQMTALTRDRAVLYRLMKSADLPGPVLYGIIGATTGWSRSGRIVAGPDAFADFIAREVPEEFVVVPCLRGGTPLVLRQEDGTLIAGGGARMTPAAVLDAAMGSQACDLAIVRERVVPHPAFGPQDGSGPWSVRVVTLVRPDGSVDVIAAFVEMHGRGARGPATGPTVADIAHDGRVGEAFSWPASGADGPPVTASSVPDWDAVLALARRAALLVAPLRTVAWEVVPTAHGPVLRDADADYAPWPSPSCRRAADILASTP
jgi:hypothetical protein